MRTLIAGLLSLFAATLAHAAPAEAPRDANACDAKGAEAFKAYVGSAAKPHAKYTLHYDKKSQHCFILIEDVGLSSAGHYEVYKSLEEVFENSQYSGYSYSTAPHSVPNYKPADPCHVTLPGGEVKTCYSEADFDKAAALFMK